MGKKFWIYSSFISSIQGQFYKFIFNLFPRKLIAIVKLKPVRWQSTTLPNLNMFGSIFIELFKKQYKTFEFCPSLYILEFFPMKQDQFQRYFEIHSTVALNAPSLPAFTFGSLISPRTANPCLHPSKYSLLYPGVNLPFPKISSALADASGGNCWSTVQELIRRGTFEVAYVYSKVFWGTVKRFFLKSRRVPLNLWEHLGEKGVIQRLPWLYCRKRGQTYIDLVNVNHQSGFGTVRRR